MGRDMIYDFIFLTAPKDQVKELGVGSDTVSSLKHVCITAFPLPM